MPAGGWFRSLNENSIRQGNYILYWIQAAHRSEENRALELAIEKANRMNLPVIAFFGLTEAYPHANDRHYTFLLQGLSSLSSMLAAKGIRMVVRRESPERGIRDLAGDAALVVVDRGYLRLHRAWRKAVADHIRCPLLLVDTNAIVPPEVASPKEEYSAATFRPKVLSRVEEYLTPLESGETGTDSTGSRWEAFGTTLPLDDIPGLIRELAIEHTVPPSPLFRGGEAEAKRRLFRFIEERLDRYPEARNPPGEDATSDLSPYLHYGQIDPAFIAREVMGSDSPGMDAFLEELIVRRELAINFVHYNPHYDSYQALPAWARETLEVHAADPREYLYSLADLETAKTHDPYWNAAQQEAKKSGKMHGYMRMYWGKKILEWSATPQEAYLHALYLNDKYEIDGRDPNGYAGVAWCFGKHDRAWKERPVFGKVRYMSDKGLERKFTMDRYVHNVNQMQ